MRTANWHTYTGPGRIMLAKPVSDLPRPYRLAPRPLYLGTKRPRVEDIWSLLAMADAAATWRWLHTLVWPYEPVLCSGAPTGVDRSYRTMMAEWLAAHLSEEIPEITDPDHRAIKVRPTLHGLRPAIWPAEPAAETAPEQV